MPRTTIASRARTATAETFRRGQRLCRLSLESLERRDCPAVVAVVGSGTIAEGGESLLLTVRLSAPDTKAVRVGYVISGGESTPSAVPADYRLSVGSAGLPGPSGNIEFRPGETVKQVRIAAVDDATREGTESLRFTLFRPVGCTVNAASSRVDISVLDNDAYTASLVPQGPSRIAEGAAASFMIELSSPATRAETFFVSTQDGTATTRDYRPLREMPVTILVGQRRSQPFALNTVADADATETDEYFLVNARPRSADMPAIDPQGVTIIGSGPAPITLSVTDTSVVEGNSGLTACTFIVRLSAPALDPIVVQYATADGTASAGVDYVAASGSLTFARGQISKTVTVNVIGDTVVEDNETFQFVASTSVGDVVRSATGVAIIRDDDTAFQIVVTFPDSSLTVAQQQVFRDAAKRWSQIIVGDLPDMPALDGHVIDDVEITATAANLPAGILGQADWTARRSGPKGLPYLGQMQFSTTYIASKVADGSFKDVILHEMGHVLGIGSLWSKSDFGFINGFGSTDPQYTGAKAVAEYRTLLGSGSTVVSVPVENEQSGMPGKPGDGSYAGHWRETVFRNELMTSVVEAPGVPMPISRLTVASLEDLGYRVNYGAADPYRLPGTIVAPGSVAQSPNLAAALTMALEQQRSKPVRRAAVFAALA